MKQYVTNAWSRTSTAQINRVSEQEGGRDAVKWVATFAIVICGGAATGAQAAILEVGAGKPYTTIQAAINATAAGDTASVYPGTYAESININKAIRVLGAQETTDPAFDSLNKGAARAGGESVINSSYPVNISASNVVLRGFEIKGFRNGVTMTGTRDNIEISYNWIHNETGSGSASGQSSLSQEC